MANDGISLQTTIAQSGSVAKTQLKGQQAKQPVTPFSEQVDQDKNLQVQRVKPTDKSERGRIDPDSEQERRHHRQRRLAADLPASGQDPEGDNAGTADNSPDEGENVGSLIDARA